MDGEQQADALLGLLRDLDASLRECLEQVLRPPAPPGKQNASATAAAGGGSSGPDAAPRTAARAAVAEYRRDVRARAATFAKRVRELDARLAELVARELQDPAVALLEETSLLRADIASKQAVLDRYRDLAAAWELEFGQLERDGVRVLCANQQRRAVPDGGAAGKGDDDRDRRPCDGAEFMEVEA